jgi:hypothetical protein
MIGLEAMPLSLKGKAARRMLRARAARRLAVRPEIMQAPDRTTEVWGIGAGRVASGAESGLLAAGVGRYGLVVKAPTLRDWSSVRHDRDGAGHRAAPGGRVDDVLEQRQAEHAANVDEGAAEGSGCH